MLRRLVTAALALLISRPAIGQERASEMVPRELAEALLGAMMGMESGLRVGTLPLAFPREFSAEPFQVLGSMTRANTGIGVVTSFDRPDSAQALTRRIFLSQGYVERQSGFQRVEGFVSPGPRPGMPEGLLCKGDDLVTVSTRGRQGGKPGSLVWITVQRASIGTCDAMAAGPSQRFASFDLLQLPLLQLPDDVQEVSTGGSGGGSDERSTRATFESALKLPALTKHFSDQLVQQGWAAGESLASADLAVSLFTRRNEKGANLRALLILHGAASKSAMLQVTREAARIR